MEKREIKDLAYIFKKVKENGEPKPIVLLGAGASISAGIPMASEIASKILEQFSDKPAIQRLKDDEKKDYYQLMSALSSDERRLIFSNYINSNDVKINVTHIYLAQLLLEGYIDYVFTPNFDDLLLKACALFNKIPPVYDISNINDFTTTNFQNQSITYLHGQHHGQWLLNAKGELDKTKEIIPKLFNRVCNKRTWIVIGYSGNDELLDEIAKFESFDNELYWIGYNNHEPIDRVKEKLLNVELKNAYLISGYDSDSFFLHLHSELKLETPEIFNKPFTFIKSMMENIKDIGEYKSSEEHKEKFDNIKLRFEKSKEMVKKAIDEIENEVVNKLEQDIIEAIIKKKFEQVEEFYELVMKNNYNSLKELLAELYDVWGATLAINATEKSDGDLYNQSFDKFKIASELNPKEAITYHNWGFSLYELAKIKSDEKLFEKSIEKYKIASKLKPYDDEIFNKWGLSIFELAKIRFDVKLFEDCFKKFKKSTELNPKKEFAYFNWGLATHELAKLKLDENLFEESIEKFMMVYDLSPMDAAAISNLAVSIYELGKLREDESLIRKSLEKFEKATGLDSKNDLTFINWGSAISFLGKIKLDRKILESSFEKFEMAIKINPKNDLAYCNWAASLLWLYDLNKDFKILEEALNKAHLAHQINNKHTYNLSCCYALMGNKIEALKYLEESLKNKNISIEHVLNDNDLDTLKRDEEFKKLLEKYKK